MPGTVRCTSAVLGSRNKSESLKALAITSDFSSGVRYMWCGSLPVGMRLRSFHRPGSITLMLASCELSTKMGAGVDALQTTGLARPSSKASKKHGREQAVKITRNHL